MNLSITSEKFSPHFCLQDSCHLWWLDLTQLDDELTARWQALLSETEWQSAQKLSRNKTRFITMRAFVRLCLSRYTNSAPHTLSLSASLNGKPFLVNNPLEIRFNLSHCNSVAVLAVSLRHEIGVDIESLTRKRNSQAIAERYFHPHEVAHLSELNAHEYSSYFFHLWTLKEAFFKARGRGISEGLAKAAFHFSDKKIHAEFADELHVNAEDWQFYQTLINENYCIALARNAGDPLNIVWFDATELFV